MPLFGGAGDEIYLQQLKHLRSNSPEVAEDYETLNQIPKNVACYATEVIRLREQLVTPRNVFVIMSFKREFRDVYATIQEVCREFGIEAVRTDEPGSLDWIIPRVETGIRKSTFVVADVSELSPNVFYEIGFARALKKDLIITVRGGTALPFDLSDIPAIPWEIQEDLKERLRKTLSKLTRKHGRGRC